MIEEFYPQKKENNNKKERKEENKNIKETNTFPLSQFQAVQNKLVFGKI